MKRIFKYLLVIAGTVLAGCAPDIDFEALDAVPALSNAPYVELASKAEVLDNSPIVSIEVTENGRYLVTTDVLSEGGMTIYKYGDCRSGCDTLYLDGFGYGVLSDYGDGLEVCFGGGQRSFIPFGEEPSAESDVVTRNLCRTWIPELTAIMVKPAGLPKVGEIYEGCDMGEIFDDVISKGVNIRKLNKTPKIASLVGRAVKFHERYRQTAQSKSVKEVTFTAQGTLIVAFSSAEPFIGSWEWLDREERIFSCSITIPDDQDRPSVVETTGQISFSADGRCDMTFDATFTSSNDKYAATLDLICRQVPNSEEL